MAGPMETRRLTARDGRTLDFTLLGFGAVPLGNYMQPLAEADCDRAVEAAWDCGVRYFDTAPVYGLGLADMRVGRVLRKLPRDQFVISTKVGRTLIPCAYGEQNAKVFVGTPSYRFEFDYSYDAVMRSFEESLRRLGLDRVDILYVHDLDSRVHGGSEGFEKRLRELFDRGGWRALDELRASGDAGRAALATFASFETNAPRFDDLLGAAIVLFQAIRDFLRVERPNGDATIIETLHDLWVLQRFPYSICQHLDPSRRRALRDRQRVPGEHIEPREPIGEPWNVRKDRRTPQRRHCHDLQLAGLHVLKHRRHIQ